MPRGDKSSYTDKQKRKAERIEESEKDEGKSAETAKRIAWATVNKQDGGGKKAAAKSSKNAAKAPATKAAKKATGKTAKKMATKAAKKTPRKAASKTSR